MTGIDPSRTAVVLGSSFLGVYAHAGLMNGLWQWGFEPARVAGASAGALAGALYASGLRGDGLREAALDLELRRSFVNVSGWLRLGGMLGFPGVDGLFHGRKTVAHLKRVLGEIDMSELPTRLSIAVTDAATAKQEIRQDGPLAELVMASCAVPVLFTSQHVGDRRYLDGGITSELPLLHLLDDPQIDTLILHRIRHETGSAPGIFCRGVWGAIGLTRRTMSREIERLHLEQAQLLGKRVLEVETVTEFPGLFTHGRAAACYDRGLASGMGLEEELDR